LQDKRGQLHVHYQPDGRVGFTCEVVVRGEGDLPDFAGPFVHGTKDERFLYLSWGYPDASGWHWIRRLKIVLTGIPFDLVQSHGELEAHVDGLTTSKLRPEWRPR
jgi:hypothetical protein